jgi:hypothetical protein
MSDIFCTQTRYLSKTYTKLLLYCRGVEVHTSVRVIIIVLFHFCDELITYVVILYILNLLHITSMFHIITVFVTADMQTRVDIQCTHISMIYCHIKFHMHSSTGTSVIALKPKAKYSFSYCYLIFCKKHYLEKHYIFFHDQLPYMISGC